MPVRSSKHRVKTLNQAKERILEGAQGEGRRTALSSVKTALDSDEEDHCGLSIEQILALKEQFDAADTDGGGSLDLNEFMDAFGSVIQSTGRKFQDQQIERLFMQIDANSDGGIDWSEFSDYMLMESEANQTEIAEKVATFYLPDRVGSNSESDWHLTPATCIILENHAGIYITASKDLTIRLWSCSLSLMKTIHCQDWVFAMCVLPGIGKLCTASADRRIRFYDIHTWDRFREILLPSPAICLCTWKVGDDEMLAYGDDKGKVTVVNISKGFVNLDPLDNEQSRLATWAKASTKTVHTGWIHEIKMIEDLGGLMTCGSDSSISIFEYPLKENPNHKSWVLPKRVLKSPRGHTKGVKCVDWVKSQKVIVSGGLERVIVIWNPYTGNPIGQLVGHQIGIEKLFYNAVFDQIVSLSQDHIVKVWDLVHSDCIQTICSIDVQTKPITLVYDQARNRLITGNRRPYVWRVNPRILLPTSETTHRSDIVAVLLNRTYGQLVTVAEDTETCVWRVGNGKKIFSYFDTKRDEDAPLSCAAFDEAGRRLMTGDHQGRVRVWNFNNGGCLKILRKPDHQGRRREVTAVTCYVLQDKKFIAASSWDRRITIWLDSFDASVDPFLQIEGHETDILSMAFTYPKNLITCALDGSMHVFDIESGAKKLSLQHPRSKADVVSSPKPVKAYMTALDTSVRSSRGQREQSLPMLPEFSKCECVERICVLITKNRTLVSVGTDGNLSFWEGNLFRLVLVVPARHKSTLGLVDVQTDKMNCRLVTGDQGGYVKLWDITEYDCYRPSEMQVKPLCFWQAHNFGVSSLDIVPYPRKTESHDDAGHSTSISDYVVVTSSADRRILAWSSDAKLIGQFGQGAEWTLESVATWESNVSQDILGCDIEAEETTAGSESDDDGFEHSDVLKLLDDRLGVKPPPVGLKAMPIKEVGEGSRKYKKKDYFVDPLTGERIYKTADKKPFVRDEKPRAMSPYLKSFVKKIDPDNVV